MKFMRVACWVWIVVSTTLILVWSPVAVTRGQADKSRPPVTRIEWIGPFGEPLEPSSSIIKTSIDFSRMIAALLAANFLPAVLLWRHDEVAGWLERQQRQPVTTEQAPSNEMLTRERARRKALARRDLIVTFTCLLICLLWVAGTIIYQQAYRVPPAAKRSSVSGTSPSPASPSKASPSPAPSSEPSDWVTLYTPSPSRIRSKSDDGEIITLEDGSVWRVYPPDRIHTASWARTTLLDVVYSGISTQREHTF